MSVEYVHGSYAESLYREAEATPKTNQVKRFAGLEQQQRLRVVVINLTQI